MQSHYTTHLESPEPIIQIIEAYKRAVLEKDVGAFVQLYDESVRVFDTWGVWSYEGSDAWRKMIEGWFSALGTELVKVTVDEMQVIGGEGLVVVSAMFSYAGCSTEGQQLRTMQNRLTWALKRVDQSWKIVHEHTSAPVGFDDGKAILQRKKA